MTRRGKVTVSSPLNRSDRGAQRLRRQAHEHLQHRVPRRDRFARKALRPSRCFIAFSPGVPQSHGDRRPSPDLRRPKHARFHGDPLPPRFRALRTKRSRCRLHRASASSRPRYRGRFRRQNPDIFQRRATANPRLQAVRRRLRRNARFPSQCRNRFQFLPRGKSYSENPRGGPSPWCRRVPRAFLQSMYENRGEFRR